MLKYSQCPSFYLSGSGVIIGATTINLTSLTDIYGNVLTMSDFGAKGYGTLEPDTTNEEAFTFTGISANANGTYSLTGVSTSLGRSPYTETPGLVRAHTGGTKVVISDTVAFWNTFANKNNDEIINGNWVFNNAPSSLAATRATTANLGNVKLTAAAMTNLGNPTISIASPAVITLSAHGLIAGDTVQFTTTGALPTGLTISTDYYVIAAGLTANAFELSATVGGAAINTSGGQSGTHTLYRTTPVAVGNEDPRLPPVGLITMFGGSAAPTGYLLCDGSAVSRTTYANLFAVLGTSYGTGNGSTTFNVPDLRARLPLGYGAGTWTTTFASTDVNTGTDVITVPANTSLYDGTPVVLTTTGALPTGLSLATTYYVIRLTSTTIKLASSLANAIAGTPVAIDITAQGSGTNTITVTLTTRALGDKGGEETRSLSVNELPSHTHSTTDKLSSANGGGSGYIVNGTTVTGATGGSTPHNVMNPFTVVNYIIKT